MKVALFIVSFTKSRQKTLRYFRVAMKGFSGSKDYCIVIYAVLGINCFLSSYFIYFLPFKVSVCT